MAVRFGKVESNNINDEIPSSSIKMGIDKAPSALIVKYITDMYSYPLDAAIRETVSNAFDSIISNDGDFANGVRAYVYDINRRIYRYNTDAPEPDLQVVNQFFGTHDGAQRAGFIAVKDLGGGMTKDELIEVYTQYGMSDKRDNDNAVGAFGLGAKSPLAYTNEFHVITKTKEDGTLFLTAYRTANDNFIATNPIEFDNNTGKVDICFSRTYKDKKWHIKSDGVKVASNKKSSKKKDEQKINEIRDPFAEDEYGTIVLFPLNDTPDAVASEKIMKKINGLLKEINGYGILDDCETRQLEDLKVFYVGSKQIEDDYGNDASIKVYFNTTKKLSFLFDTIARGYQDFAKTNNVAFKIGNWLYNIDGSIWHAVVDGDYKQQYFTATVPIQASVIIDVPPNVLSFVPSRDAIRDDSDNKETILYAVYEMIKEFITSPYNIAKVVNASSYVRNDGLGIFQYNVYDGYENALMSKNYNTDLTMQQVEQNGKHKDELLFDFHYKERQFGYSFRRQPALSNDYHIQIDANKIELVPGRAFEDLVQTPVLVCGLVQDTGTGAKHKGIYAVSKIPGVRIFGNLCLKDNDAIKHYAGYAIASSKTEADDIVAYGNYDAADGGYKGLGDKQVALMGSNSRLTDENTKENCCIPYGIAVPHIMYSEKITEVVIVDASQIGINKARQVIHKIKTFEQGSQYRTMKALYLLIPPKDEKQTSWTKKEIDDIVSDIKDIIAQTNNIHESKVTFFDAKALEKSIKDSKSKKKKTTYNDKAEWRKMLSSATIKEIKNIDGEQYKEVFDVTRPNVRDFNPFYEELMNEPSKWGIIVASDNSKTRDANAAERYVDLLAITEMLPTNITKIICMYAKNFNPSRCKMALDAGMTLLYDEEDKGQSNDALIPSSEIKTLTNHHIVCKLPLSENVANAYKSVYQKNWEDRTTVQIFNTFNETYRNKDRNSYYYRTPMINMIGSRKLLTHDIADLVMLASVGQETYQHINIPSYSIAKWKQDCINDFDWAASWEDITSIDTQGLLEDPQMNTKDTEKIDTQKQGITDSDKNIMSVRTLVNNIMTLDTKINTALKVWNDTMTKYGMRINLSDVKTEDFQDIINIGKTMMVDIMTDAINNGVPIEDVYADIDQ